MFSKQLFGLMLCGVLQTSMSILVKIGASATPNKTISISTDVTKCHVYPANEAYGLLFEHKLSTGKLFIGRVDTVGGWSQADLSWECSKKGEDMHLPVEFRFIPNGANCHKLYDPKPFFAKTARDTRWTTQISMNQMCQISGTCEGRNVPQIYQKFFGDIQHTSNWVSTWHTTLRIDKKGKYTFVKQIGYAETAVAFLNGVEMFRSRCREPLVVTDLTLDVGLYDLALLVQDDGWEDSLLFMYNGPDSGNKLKVIPSSAFVKPCAKNEFYDTGSNNKCTTRSTCKNNYIASVFPDEDCVACKEDGVHRCVDGEHVPLTTPWNGSHVPATKASTTEAPHDEPTCDGCAYRIKSCPNFPPINNTWDVDYIGFMNNGIGFDASQTNKISSGYDHGSDANHDYHASSYEPDQAFVRGMNLWRGKKNAQNEWYIGFMSEQAVAIDAVQFMSGSCGNKGYEFWTKRKPRVFNVTKCIDFQKWDGNKWATLNRTTKIDPCRMTTIDSSGKAVECKCAPAAEGGLLGNKVCNPKCNSLLCGYDYGDCRVCPAPGTLGGLPTIANGKYKMLNGSHVSNSTYGQTAQVECNVGYQVNQSTNFVFCNTSDPNDWLSAVKWDWTSATVPSCVPLQCPTPALTPALVIKSTHQNNQVLVSETIEFGCNSTHYIIQGSEAVECLKDGDGGKYAKAFPTCKRLNCDADALQAPTFGILTVTDTLSGGDGVTFDCNVGYDLKGASSVTCEQTTWSDSAPTCEAKTCPLFSVSNGAVASAEPVFKSQLAVTCDTGFRLSDTSPTCVLNSDSSGVEWDSIVSCVPITCDVCETDCNEHFPPDKDANANITNTVAFGTKVSYTCSGGAKFVLVGASELECGATGFDYDVPYCKMVQCDPLTKDTFPRAVITGATQTRYADQSVTITCPKGYQVGEVTRTQSNPFYTDGDKSTSLTCSATGWGSEELANYACQPRGCPKPPSASDRTLIGSVKYYSVGDKALFNCDNTNGQQKYVCQTSQIWAQLSMNGVQDACATPQPTTSTPTYMPTPAPQAPTQSPQSPTVSPTPGADNFFGEESKGDLSAISVAGTSVIAVVVILVLLAIVGAFCYVSRVKKARAADPGVKSFENPMYDSNPNTYDTVVDDNAYEEPQFMGNDSSSGYMDVPAATQPITGGYMDVSPANDKNGFDEDDNGTFGDDDEDEEDI